MNVFGTLPRPFHRNNKGRAVVFHELLDKKGLIPKFYVVILHSILDGTLCAFAFSSATLSCNTAATTQVVETFTDSQLPPV